MACQRYDGIRKGSIEWAGPQHPAFVTTFWDLHRFDEAGLIVQTWNLTDSLALMHQLGLLAPP